MAVDRRSVDVKLDRADELFDEVIALVQDFGERRPYRLGHRRNADATEHYLVVDFDVPPDTLRWGGLFGEATQALRSALDHAVYAIAVDEAGRTPPPDHTKLAFPIAEPGHRLARWRIESLSRRVQDQIIGEQPNEQTGRGMALLVLNRIVQADKHRLVTATTARVAAAQIELSNLVPGTECAVTWHRGHGVDEGEPFLTLRTAASTPNLGVGFDADFYVSIDRGWEGPDVDPPPLQDLATGLRADVGAVIDRLIERSG